MKKKWLWPIYLILLALSLAGGYFFSISPAKRAGLILSAADFAGRQEWRGLEATLLVKGAEVNPDNTSAMLALIQVADLREQQGQTDQAREIVWQMLEKYCPSPPEGPTFQEDGEGLCQTALSRVIDYEQARLGKTVKMGSKEETAVLEKIYRGNRPADIRALAGYMMVFRNYFAALAQHQDSPKYKPFSRSSEKLSLNKEFADRYVALADEFPKSYWASRASASACGHYYHAGEKDLARREAARLLKEFPDTPAAHETRQDQAFMDWINDGR